MKNSSLSENSEIVFFDGVCNLCNSFVDFVIRRSSRHKFASLQGKTAGERLPREMIAGLPSLVLLQDGRLFVESTAALKIIAGLGGVFAFARLFLLVPKFLRDGIYRFIARHRYSWFGQRETCRLPSAKERSLFLD